MADLNDDMLMSQMKDSRDIHSEQPETPLRMTYDLQGQPSLQPYTTAGVQGISASHPQQILPPYRVPWMLQLCGNLVVNVSSTCTFLCSLDRWPMFLIVIEVFGQLEVTVNLQVF